MSEQAFGIRLAAAIADRGPLCAGIDPHPSLLRAWGLSNDIAGLQRFCDICVEAFGSVAAMVKPQAAFFETFGSAGIAVLERLISQARAAGALVLLDAKRGDIGSTMAAYAQAYLADGPMSVDALTVSPYLGFGSLRPAIDLALANNRGLFVLGLTSNPEGPQVQHAVGADGRSVAQTIADAAAEINATAGGLGSIGLVIGATVGATGIDLTKVNGPFLAPGIGAQGATPADLRTVFGTNLSAVVPSVSREILNAGPDLESLTQVALRLTADLRAGLS